jgi:hypothetical protein
LTINAAIPSLIHYLESDGAEFYLKLSLSTQNDSFPKKIQFPFSVIGESDSLASIFEASIVSDAGSRIKNAFLLIQKDIYTISADEKWPGNNRDIDRAWQSLFSFLTASCRDDSIVILKDQIDNTGTLLPWQSLFYCSQRQIFFQPSCARCGFSLHLCHDEDLLLHMGLQPYSTSLKRYLYCPNCLDTLGQSDFYAHSLDEADPKSVKDQDDLIKGFGQLARIGIEKASIPCIGCAHFEECYETQHLSVTRIVPISFYPFFMIVFNAPSIHVLDLLPILAGADSNDVATRLQTGGEEGRLRFLRNFEQQNPQNTLFFFGNHEKFFLEVLYLKLSLLGGLAQIVLSGMDIFKYPNLSLSMDKIWVTAADQSGMLPVLWNFKLNLMGIGGKSAHAPFLDKSSSSYSLSFLGSSWFFVLLENSIQDFSRIYEEISKVFENISSKDDLGPELSLRIQHSPVFSPENIFWNPAQNTLDTSWAALWARALDLGVLLLRSSMSEISQWSQTRFWQEYEKLEVDVRNELFTPVSTGISSSTINNNKAIHEILLHIARKWQSSIQPVSSKGEEVSVELQIEGQKSVQVISDLPEDVIIKETVILSADDFKEELPSSEVEEDHVPEMVVAKAEPVQPIEPPAPQPADDIPATVIISKGTPKREIPPPAESLEPDIPKTIIVSPQGPSASQINKRQERSEGVDDSGLIQQAVSNTGSETPDKETPPRAKQKDDDIPETVIFDPTKAKDE